MLAEVFIIIFLDRRLTNIIRNINVINMIFSSDFGQHRQ